MQTSTKSEWWRGCVLYQVYPRSFCDSNADGVGDLAGIISKLDYLASLGIEGLWISPFFKSPMKDFGYDVSDYRDVDPQFGTIDDFRRLLGEAHKRDLKILIDQVWSHSSDEHDWFKESRSSRDNSKADWYVWADPTEDGLPPNNWLSIFGGPAWTWDPRREQYYLHHHLSCQPNLNHHNPKVKAAIKEIAAYWLDMGVDGFRLDVAHTYMYDAQLRNNPVRGPNDPVPSDMKLTNPMSYQRRVYSTNTPETLPWIEELRSYVNKWDNRCLLAEAGGDDAEKEAASYVQTGKRFHMAYSFGLVGSNLTKEDIISTISHAEDLIDDGWLCWSTGNHDFKRAISRVETTTADKTVLAKYLMVLGLTLRGSFCIYQGEELGLPQAELSFEDLLDPYDIALYPDNMGRDGARTPIPWHSNAPHAGFSDSLDKCWLPIPTDHAAIAADLQEHEKDSVLNTYRDFMKWRKTIPALRYGSFSFIENTPDGIVAYKREKDGQIIFCALNTTEEEKSWQFQFVTGKTSIENKENNVKIIDDTICFAPFGYCLIDISE